MLNITEETTTTEERARVYEHRYLSMYGEGVDLVAVPAGLDQDSWMAGYIHASEEAGVKIDSVMARPDLRSYQVHHEVATCDGKLTPRMWRFFASGEAGLKKQLRGFCGKESIVHSITKIVPE